MHITIFSEGILGDVAITDLKSWTDILYELFPYSALCSTWSIYWILWFWLNWSFLFILQETVRISFFKYSCFEVLDRTYYTNTCVFYVDRYIVQRNVITNCGKLWRGLYNENIFFSSLQCAGISIQAIIFCKVQITRWIMPTTSAALGQYALKKERYFIIWRQINEGIENERFTSRHLFYWLYKCSRLLLLLNMDK